MNNNHNHQSAFAKELYQLAATGSQLKGCLNITQLGRLKPLVIDATNISYQLAFSQHKSWPLIKGHIKASITQECQRCLTPFAQDIDIQVNLTAVEVEGHFDAIKRDSEPFLLNNSTSSLIDLIEDELLLIIPAIPKHSDEDLCQSG